MIRFRAVSSMGYSSSPLKINKGRKKSKYVFRTQFRHNVSDTILQSIGRRRDRGLASSRLSPQQEGFIGCARSATRPRQKPLLAEEPRSLPAARSGAELRGSPGGVGARERGMPGWEPGGWRGRTASSVQTVAGPVVWHRRGRYGRSLAGE